MIVVQENLTKSRTVSMTGEGQRLSGIAGELSGMGKMCSHYGWVPFPSLEA